MLLYFPKRAVLVRDLSAWRDIVSVMWTTNPVGKVVDVRDVRTGREKTVEIDMKSLLEASPH